MGARFLRRRRDALHGMGEIEERLARIPGRVLDGAADQADFAGEADGLRRRLRRIAEAFFKVGRYRQVDRLDDQPSLR